MANIFRIILLTLVLSACSLGAAPAQEGAAPVPAEKAVNGVGQYLGSAQCDETMAAADRMHCENLLLDTADAELNRVYGVLMEVLSEEQRKLLQASQREWLKFRDLDYELFSSAASHLGRRGQAERLAGMRRQTQQRVRELEILWRLQREVVGLEARRAEEQQALAAASAQAVLTPQTPQPQAPPAMAPVAQTPTPAPGSYADAPPTVIQSTTTRDQLLGRHSLRLQWLSSKRSGEAVIEDQGGVLVLRGSQGEGKDALVVEGRISTVTAQGFFLHGTVTTRISYLNDGKPCVREGRMLFAVKSKRPFWRLQSITNPCSQVTDYIDIYIERLP